MTFLDFGSVVRPRPRIFEYATELLRAVLRQDVQTVWEVALRAGIWSASDPITAQEGFAYWRGQRDLWFAEQPFTVTPEYMAAHVERQLSPSGPSGDAMRHVTSPPDFAMLNRMDLGVPSVTAELRATADWRAIADEWFEAAPPKSELGRLHARWLDEHPTAIKHA